MATQLKRIFSVFILLFFTSSCMTQRFYLSDKPLPHRDADYDRRQHFFVSGLGQTNDVDIKYICKDKKPSHIETKLSFFDIILSFASRGLYTPRTAKVYCED